MKLKVYFGIAVRIILLFVTAMMMTYVTEELRTFFGDTYIGATKITSCCGEVSRNGFDASYKWGARHYWYFHMCLLLFILSLISLSMSIVDILKKNYNIKF